MKNPLKYLLIGISFATASVAFAQDDDGPPLPEERMQEIKAQKSAYLTQKMSLLPEEAQRFWPIYNQMDEELGAARREHRTYMRELRDREAELTEKEANDLLDRELAMEEKQLAVKKKYDPQLRKAIGAQKLVQMHKAERDFHREVMKRFRDRGDGMRGGGDQGGRPRGGPPR